MSKLKNPAMIPVVMGLVASLYSIWSDSVSGRCFLS